MKNTEVEKIRYWTALVGQLGRSKNSRSYFKHILCCSLPTVTPRNKFYQLGIFKNVEGLHLQSLASDTGNKGGERERERERKMKEGRSCVSCVSC